MPSQPQTGSDATSQASGCGWQTPRAAVQSSFTHIQPLMQSLEVVQLPGKLLPPPPAGAAPPLPPVAGAPPAPPDAGTAPVPPVFMGTAASGATSRPPEPPGAPGGRAPPAPPPLGAGVLPPVASGSPGAPPAALTTACIRYTTTSSPVHPADHAAAIAAAARQTATARGIRGVTARPPSSRSRPLEGLQ